MNIEKTRYHSYCISGIPKGCRLCVEFCPTDVLAMDEDDHPYVAHPELCSACHWCDTHCPDLAIVVKPI